MADTSDRTIPATPRRREAARRAGLSAPADLPAWAASAATALVLAPWWARTTIPAAADGVREVFTATLVDAGAGSQVWPLPIALVLPTLVVVTAAAAAGLVVRFACDGVSWQPQRAAPDLRRIDPLAGLARIFSRATLGTLLTGAMGLAVLLATAAFAGRPLLAVQATLPEPGDLGPLAVMAWQALAWLMAGAAGVAFGQWLLARRRFERGIRMTPQELAEEQKEMQADPRVRLLNQRRTPRTQQAGTS
jgi:flagellar biosynthesis protein FlhB